MRVSSSWVARTGLCLVALGLASVSAYLPAAPRPVGKPDLSIDEARLGTSLYFKTLTFGKLDCAVVEGCVNAAGTRKLMRFDVAIRNMGKADLVLGKPARNPTWYELSTCHGHYHFTGFITYELFDLAGNAVPGIGRKQAFCLEDYERIPGYVGGGRGKFTCSNQGITVGWQDVYRAELDCQWLDVTGVAPGKYILTVTVDAPTEGAPFGKIDEQQPAPVEGEKNNVAVIEVTIPVSVPIP